MANQEQFESLLHEHGKYSPGEKTIENARVKDYEKLYKESAANPEKFWEGVAGELHWFKKWDKVLDWQYPYAKWFVGAKTNITYNCLDVHMTNGNRNKVAYIWTNEAGDEKIFTYGQLYMMVGRFANGLKSLGLKEGDRVAIYMPLIIEQIVAMLACARLGIIHSVVYAGFSSAALKQRIEDSEAKVVITADVGFRRGKKIQLKAIVDEAVQGVEHVDNVIVVNRNNTNLSGKEVDFHSLMTGKPEDSPAAQLDSEAPLFYLYTSGSTGKPKGVVHTHGGYMVQTYYTTRVVFDVQPSDIYWCTADPGWITGHSYMIYGPLANGVTTLLFEGAPDYPDAGIWWSVVEKYRVNIFYTAPTAIRMFMKLGPTWPAKYDLSSLRLLGSVGEPINPEAWLWYYEHIGGKNCPVIDTWWQTETASHVVTTLPSYPSKPGRAGKAIPGMEVDIVDKDGNPAGVNKGGFLVIKKPWPSMMRGIYKNAEKYESYWNTIPNCYLAGDVATKDDEGYIMVLGRSDDVIKVAGHRLGTAEIESSLVSHPAVAESAAIGKPDEVKGESIKVFVILKHGITGDDKLKADLQNHVRHELGALAVPSEIDFVASLPKTRSGKIMRRILKAKELGMELGDTSTLEE